MLQHDLAAARIPATTSEPTLDFHALRATFITHLALAGVNLAIVQRLARHSSITLTMQLYAKITEADSRRPLESAMARATVTPKSLASHAPSDHRQSDTDGVCPRPNE
jgi:integrase